MCFFYKTHVQKEGFGKAVFKVHEALVPPSGTKEKFEDFISELVRNPSSRDLLVFVFLGRLGTTCCDTYGESSSSDVFKRHFRCLSKHNEEAKDVILFFLSLPSAPLSFLPLPSLFSSLPRSLPLPSLSLSTRTRP